MLQSLRNSSQSWIMKTFLALLIIGFVVLWGSGDVGRFLGGGTDPVVVTVGSKSFTRNEVIRRMQRLAAMRLPAGTDPAPYKELLKQQVLQQIVTQTLLDLEAERLGVVVGDVQVSQAIQQMPNFKDEDGDFDKLIFEASLRRLGFSENEFTEIVRRELQRQQLIQTLTSGIVAPQAMVTPLAAWVDEKREVEALEIIAKEMPVPLPTEEQLQKFYQDNPKLFTSPENRQISLIALTRDVILERTKLTDDEKREGFKVRRNEFKGPVPTETEAAKIEQALKQEKVEKRYHELVTKIDDDLAGGASLEEITKEYDLPLVRLNQLQSNGTFQPAKNSAPLDTSLIKDVVTLAFEAPENEEMMNLVETDSGAFLAIKVEKIIPSAVKPLDQVKNQVVKEWQQEQQVKLAQEKGKKIAQAPQAQEGLASFAQGKAFQNKSSFLLTRDNGEHKDLIHPQLRSDIFKIPLNQVAVGNTENGLVLVRVTNIIRDKTPKDKESLEKIQTDIHIQLQDDLLNQLLIALERQYKVDENTKALNMI